MLKRIFAYGLLLLVSSLAIGQENNNEIKYNQLLNDCIEQQFANQETPKLNKEIDLLEECPDLSILLATREINGFIQPPLESDTTLNRLLDEQKLRRQVYQAPISTLTDLTLVEDLAKNYNLDSSDDNTPSWWQIFKQWLKDNYSSDEEDANIDWLIKLLDGFSIPDWLYKTILYGSIVLIIIFAITIIVNEFRHYKRFKNRDTQKNDLDNLDPLHEFRKLDWDEIQDLPFNQRTSALLQYLIQQCIDRDWLPNNNSFTNREFYRSLMKLDSNKAVKFNTIVNAAERAIYGNHTLTNDELNQLRLITKELLNNNELMPS